MSAVPRTVTAIDWDAWRPTHYATLLFVVREGKILLIRKKRGLGAGKINGPGGKIDGDESPKDAAVREVQEELRVTPLGVTERGQLSFQFTDGYAIHVTVFDASDVDGEPTETDEAVPLWTSVDEIPYSEMWADDELWLPLMLSGERFLGRFIFDGDRMLDHSLMAGNAGAA